MIRFTSFLAAVLVGVGLFAVTAKAVATPALVIETVPVGNTGNANDGTGYGAVNYTYSIGKFEVTNLQYCEFLNAKAAGDSHALYHTSMSSDSQGGIDRTGTPGDYLYSVKSGYENIPVVYVSWHDAIRFANWLTNGQGNGATETGSYTITNGGANSGTVSVPDAAQRATWAAGSNTYWLLPSENERYKAAYHQPGGDAGGPDTFPQ